MNPRLYNMVGKDPVFQDSRDPLGASTKSVAEQKLMLDKYRLYNESRCDLDFVIQDFASKATNGYKTKARNTKGSSQAMYKRTLLFINQHVAEFVL
jgi:hypothetical protein